MAPVAREGFASSKGPREVLVNLDAGRPLAGIRNFCLHCGKMACILVIALLADIHSNLEAFRACLDHARAAGATRFALLGDLVGYGADPNGVVDIAIELAAAGAIAVKGNHDEAVDRPSAYLNESARAAIDWTRGVLGAVQKRFLAELPLSARDERRFFVHATADRPARWGYIDGPSAALRCMDAAGSAYTLCGHVHDPRLYFDTGPGRVGSFRPTPGTQIRIPHHRRWLAIPGSVGQPRDGNPRAAYALLDADGERITFHRVPYDHHAVAEKMRVAGLPASLVYRMQRGI